MKKEIRTVDRDRGILHVTTVDERWYACPSTDAETGLPCYRYVPSVTWITSHFPKGVGFYKWLATKGWDESEAIKAAAGDKGSKVHQGITRLIDGETVEMGSLLVNPSTGQPEEISLEEYECLLSFRDWWAAMRPRTVWREQVVWNMTEGYAGTLDWFGFLDPPDGKLKGLWLIDWKTGQDVWPDHELQVSAYRHALVTEEMPEDVREVYGMLGQVRLGILQVGYRRNQRGWKLTEVEDQFDVFLATHRIWAKQTAGEAPKQAEYPLSVSLNGEPPAPVASIPKRRKAKRESIEA